MVARGHENTRAAKSFSRRDQGLQVKIGFRRGVAEESEARRVCSNTVSALDDRGSALLDRPGQLRTSIESMYPAGQRVACVTVSELGGSHGTSGNTPLPGASLHAGKRLADSEAEAGIKCERATVIRNLY